MTEPWGVYVHIPWCAVRCPYCAFAVDARRERPERAYTDAVLQQWAAEKEFFPGRPSTVFFGGGTPSQADPAELQRILVALDPAPGAEISAEVNPGRLDLGRIDALHQIGVTRVSIGVQSFQPAVARRLGRAHSARDARRAWDAARRRGFRTVSVDLIFDVPGQTMADLDADLAVLAAEPPDHVSLYGLTLEPETPFGRAAARDPAAWIARDADDRWRAMYDRARDALEAVGLAQYEVSNFARPGHRCVHNEHYWRARPWAGLGTSAHGFRPDACRTRAVPDVDAFLAAPTPIVERPEAELLAAELVGSTIRHVDGLELAGLEKLTGLTVDLAAPGIVALVRHGVLQPDRNSLRIRKKDLAVADHVAVRVCGALRAGAATL